MAARGGATRRAAISASPSQFEAAAVRAGLSCLAGKASVEAGYRPQIAVRHGYAHTGSIDLDDAFRTSEPNATRWDYGLGLHASDGTELAIWVEPHPASSSKEVDQMLGKLSWLKAKLDSTPFRGLRALRDATQKQGAHPYRWLTTLSGRICIAPGSKEARRLAQAGLDRPRRQLLLP